jgi:hypothetical protein
VPFRAAYLGHKNNEKLLQKSENILGMIAFGIQYSIFLENLRKLMYNKIDRYLSGGFHGKEIDKI